jgi:hypothetical protein
MPCRGLNPTYFKTHPKPPVWGLSKEKQELIRGTYPPTNWAWASDWPYQGQYEYKPVRHLRQQG